MKRPFRFFFAATAFVSVVGVLCLVVPDKSTSELPANSQSENSKPHSLPNHPVVARVIREGPDLPYLKFNYLIKELPLSLAPHDIEALITFISGPRPVKFQDAEWGSLVNDIEENLTVQTIPSERVAQSLIAIYRDEAKIQMQRDYALQHIGGFAIYLIHTASNGAQASAGESSSFESPIPHLQSILLSELTSAARDRSKPWSGTALNLLDGCLRAAEYRSVEIPGLNTEALVALALPAARDSSAPLNSRLPALQLATRRDSPAALELAREILSSPEPGLMLTQSASAALARLGTADDIPLLQTASAKATRHTAPALNEAIRSIQSRSRPD